MQIPVWTNYQQCILVVKFKTASPQKLRIIFKDATQARTEYTNRYKTVNGEWTCQINCPITKKDSILLVYNEAVGDVPNDSSFQIMDCYPIPLEKRWDMVDFSDPQLKAFIKFSQNFCINAGVLPCGTYVSDDKYNFRIEYLPTIISSETGKPMNTSARINKMDGGMQVSQEKFDPMTVSGREVTMLHEYSHYYININIENEVEADLNGLAIYLGLGYPRVDAKNVFADAFYNAAFELNYERMQIIEKFIDDFDKSKIIVY